MRNHDLQANEGGKSACRREVLMRTRVDIVMNKGGE